MNKKMKPSSVATASAAQIIAALRALHTQKQDPRALPDAFYAEVKSGPSWGQGGRPLYIFDAIAIARSWAKPCIYGYEIKINRSDFNRGKKKALREYTKYCHKFSFVCPPGVITLEDLKEHGDVGLIYYSAEHDVLYVKRRAMRRDLDLRSREVTGMLMYLAMYRGEGEGESDKRGGKSCGVRGDGDEGDGGGLP